MSWRSVMGAAFFATLGRGSWWPVALATFLVRGGLLVVIPPILILPTPAELEGLVPPSIVGTGFVTPTSGLVILAASVAALLAIAFVASTIVGAWLETRLVVAAAADDELASAIPGRTISNPSVRAAAAIRLLAHVPTLVVLVATLSALTGAITAVATSPDVGGSLVLGVLSRIPGPVALLVVAWLIGEAWGGTALRRLALGAGPGRALARGLRDLVRPSALALLLGGSVVVTVALLVLWFAAARAFDRLWPLVVDNADPALIAIALGLTVATWAASLWLLAIGLTWRATAWTAEVARRP